MVIRRLITNLYFAGTEGKKLMYISNLLQNSRIVAEWDMQLMGPVLEDQLVQ